MDNLNFKIIIILFGQIVLLKMYQQNESNSFLPKRTAHSTVILTRKSSSRGLNRFHLQMKRYFITKIPISRNKNPCANAPFSIKIKVAYKSWQYWPDPSSYQVNSSTNHLECSNLKIFLCKKLLGRMYFDLHKSSTKSLIG